MESLANFIWGGGQHKEYNNFIFVDSSQLPITQSVASKMSVRDELCCPICYGFLYEPVRLRCGHYFCMTCIRLHCLTRKNQGLNAVCSMCRHRINDTALRKDDERERAVISSVGNRLCRSRRLDDILDLRERAIRDADIVIQSKRDVYYLQDSMKLIGKSMFIGTVSMGLIGAVAGLGFATTYGLWNSYQVQCPTEDERIVLVDDTVTSNNGATITNATLYQLEFRIGNWEYSSAPATTKKLVRHDFAEDAVLMILFGEVVF